MRQTGGDGSSNDSSAEQVPALSRGGRYPGAHASAVPGLDGAATSSDGATSWWPWRPPTDLYRAEWLHRDSGWRENLHTYLAGRRLQQREETRRGLSTTRWWYDSTTARPRWATVFARRCVFLFSSARIGAARPSHIVCVGWRLHGIECAYNCVRAIHTKNVISRKLVCWCVWIGNQRIVAQGGIFLY